MKVLLLENVQGLGKKGDIVEVKDGYGQNFLIAKKKAQLATNEVINKYKAQVRADEQKRALEHAELEQLASSINGITIKIKKRTGAQNALFGAVTKDEIANALNEHLKVQIDKKWVVIKDSIKHLGEFELELKLGQGVMAKFKLVIESQS